MKTLKLKKMSLPKVAVLATGLTVAVLVGTTSVTSAQAEPSYGGACTSCHDAGGSVSATPSSTTVAPGAAYTVAIAVTTTNAGNTGYAIYNSDAAGTLGSTVTTGEPGAATTYSAAMTAPATAGTYYYMVWANKGTPPGAASTVNFSITVAAAATTAPVTTPPVTTPPVTTPPVTTPPVTTLPVTSPPVTSTPPSSTTTDPSSTTTTDPSSTTTTTAPVVPATTATIAPVVSDASAVIPVGAPNTGAGGATRSTDGPLVGLGGVALLLAGVGATQVIRRRRQV